MRLDISQSLYPPTKKQKIVEESEKVSSRVAKSKKQSDKLSKDKNLASPSIDLSEPRVSLDVPNIEMRDADKLSVASKEKLSLSKSDLDEIKSYVRTYVDMKFNDLQKLMVDQYTGLLEVVKEDVAGKSSKLGGNEGEAEESFKESEEALHNTDKDLSKAITLYVPPSRAAYPTWINYIDIAAIDTCDRQGNIDSHCYISGSTISAISQVPVCKTNLKYVRKLSSKRNRQPSRVYQSPFVSEFDSGSKDKEAIHMLNINRPYAEDLFSKFSVWMSDGLYNPHATKKGKDEYFMAKYADLKPSLDFVVAHPYINVVFYYLRKKAKLDTTSEYRYTTVNCVFMSYIHDTYTHYHRSHSEIDLSSHVENVCSMKVALVERSICEIMQGICIPAGIPWHLIDEVYVPINYKGSFHWVLAVIVLKKRSIRAYDSMKGHRGHADEIKELAEILLTYLTISDFFKKKDRTDWSLLDAYKEKSDQHAFDVHIVDGIVQQSSGTLDCGLFVATYAEFLSDRPQIPSSEFDSKKHRTRYASLL
ncbi:hypothetical protein CQW23_17063 [Capsicum baccatum]|uniref:Ubiquitin-like protease family profile domain-containing protein n=1 Tax=Capsicum baccatum TaxID=33114 RepID=A0A2G2WCT4_CAPBA|nr:hypothetical protein CQW23_17063 [Capsicum baccatum]